MQEDLRLVRDGAVGAAVAAAVGAVALRLRETKGVGVMTNGQAS